tara:strand:- start:15 stop:1940 length:1926 start_codon:yes stop_codon:yes gene_type:complete
MAYKNTVKDYSQMIGYLTRDKTTDVPGSMAHGLRTGLYDGGRVPFGEGSITKIRQLSKAVKEDPKLVDLFNKDKLYHIRTTVGGSTDDRKIYRGTKKELKDIMKQKKSTGKPVVLTEKMKANIKEYEDRTGKKYEDLNRNKQMQVRKGKQAGVGTLPSKEEMKDKISIKQKGKTGSVSAIEDVIFPNDKMKEKFLTELELKYTYVPGKSMPEKYKSKNFAQRYPISERQFERMVSFYVNKKGLTYPKGGEASQVIAKRRDLQKKVTGIKTENTIVDKIKKPILVEKNLSNKIDLAHRVSMEHMARLGLEYDTRLLGMDSRLINQAIVKPAEFKLSKIYEKQFDLMKKIEKSGLTTELKDELTDINDRVKKTIKKTSGRLFGITVDPQTLEPSFEGIKKKFSLTSKDINLKELDKLPRKERIKLLSPYVSKKVDSEIKRGFRPADFKEILQNKDSRNQVLSYVKKFAPDILGKVKKAIANPASKESFGLYSNPFFDPKLMGKVVGDLGKGINVGLGPTGILALNTALGTDPTQSLDRVGLGLEATFAKPLVKGATSVTDKIKNPMLRKVAERAALAGMSPAMAMKVARIASPIGIASLAGEGLYQVGKLGYEDQQRFNALSPEEQAAERAEQEKFAFDIEGS